MTLHWFFSKTLRHAVDMHKHVRRMRNAQSDILSPAALQALDTALDQTQRAMDSKASKEDLLKQMAELEKVAGKWLKPYPHPVWRENIEVLLVAIAVAMGIRTFFLQPFKIPTGSMQPTLFGVTTDNLKDEPSVQIPGFARRFWDAAVGGVFYHKVIAEDDGELIEISPPEHVFRFINKTRIVMRYRNAPEPKPHTIWFTPEDRTARFGERAGIHVDQTFRKGEYIVKMRDIAGDHLFVDRVTYNFRRPQRGEIIVFKTRNIDHPYFATVDDFYIKRLVALPNEHVRIGNDRHVIINGNRLDASTPHFESVYSFKGMPRDSHYSGHVSGPALAPLLPDEQTEFVVRSNRYFVMGDNTVSSFDSRAWGDFPRENVIGKSFFVYWPISNREFSRFGWAQR
jgi:signal peptidase I